MGLSPLDFLFIYLELTKLKKIRILRNQKNINGPKAHSRRGEIRTMLENWVPNFLPRLLKLKANFQLQNT